MLLLKFLLFDIFPNTVTYQLPQADLFFCICEFL